MPPIQLTPGKKGNYINGAYLWSIQKGNCTQFCRPEIYSKTQTAGNIPHISNAMRVSHILSSQSLGGKPQFVETKERLVVPIRNKY
jgi:hypothetical protein